MQRRKNKREQDIQDEIRAHLNMAAQDHAESGEHAADAAAHARRDFGNLTLAIEDTRRVWIANWFDTFVQDLQHALRTLRMNPGFATVALLSLALGIGVNTTIFTLLDRAVLRPLPVERPEQLYILRTRQGDDVVYRNSYPQYLRVRAALPAGSIAAAMTRVVRYQMNVDGISESVASQLVTGEWFEMLGVQPVLGRIFQNADKEIGTVISHGLWQRRFGADRSVIGKRITVNGAPVTIVGVAPEHFFGTSAGTAPELWLPAAAQAELRHFSDASASDGDIRKPWIPQEGVSWLNLMIRVAQQSQLAEVSGRLSVLFRRRVEEAAAQTTDPADREQILKTRFEIVPGARGFDDLRKQVSAMLYVLMATAGLVLLIACANIANLLLARGAARVREIAIRQALGAGRIRIFRQLVTENAILAVAGSACGLIVASLSAPALLGLLAAGPTAIPLDLAIDFRVLAFAAALAIATTVLFGVAPAVRLSKPQLAASMSTGLRTVAGRRGAGSLRRLLVAGQVALSLALLVGAGLFARSLLNLTRVDAGYERERLLTVRMDPRAGGYSEEQLPAFYQRLLAAVRSVPGVRDASFSLYSLASGSARTSTVFIAGRPPQPGEDNDNQENFVGPDYFETVGIPIIAGRAFSGADDAKAPKVALINQTMARRWFRDQNPIGRRFGYDRAPKDSTYEIIGVVRDAQVNNLREAAPKMIYYSLAQHPHEYVRSIDVRLSLPSASVIPSLRRAIASVDAMLPVREIVTVDEQVNRTLRADRVVMQLTAAFSLLGLALACIGLYGVLSYTVRQRTTEIGVRVALGASRIDILRMVMREALIIVAAGAAVGIAVALGAGRVLATMLFGLTPADPLTLSLTTILLIAVAMLAAFLPARRAAGADPITALRCE